ncbi:NYN domain-containing protein [bacterium]|nr:NYN domain-containing protein [bacterium]
MSPNVAVVTRRPAMRAAANHIPRRCVFVDVENTSSEEDLFEVLEALHLDHAAQPTEVAAVGNWRAIGQRLARRLAATGAQLVHSAPATGVKDWSDLWIAVAAGCWLGSAQPGDVLEIVSNDRAFDAVGDAASARGVTFRRLLHKRGAAAAVPAPVEDEEEPKRRRRSRGGRRRRGRGAGATPVGHEQARESAPPPTHPAPRAAPPKPAHRATAHSAPPAHPAHPSHAPLHDAEAHGATRDQILSVIGRLSGSDPHRWINLDVLEKALKAEGFARPPGSPRLVTRLRMLKDIELDSHGRARLAATATPPEVPAPAAEVAAAPAEAAEAPPKRRRRSRKAPGGGDADEAVTAETASFAAAAYSEPSAE